MNPMNHYLDPIARRLFFAAVEENRCGELLECIFGGGSATVDDRGHLVLASSDIIDQLGGSYGGQS